VAGPLRLHSAQSRLAAFKKALQECGIPVEEKFIIEGDHTMEGGLAAAARILEHKNLPTAIMCSNDMLAIGVLHKLSRSGLQVPGDVSIIGFDDIHMAEIDDPLADLDSDVRADLARAAVSALRTHLEGSTPKREYTIDTIWWCGSRPGFPRGTMTRLRKFTAKRAESAAESTQ